MRVRRLREFPNYAVIDDGRVWSIKSHKWLKPAKLPNGYLQICLCSGGGKFYRFIHRLVATEFIDNPENKPTVDHIDRDRANNNVSNLRWATAKEQNMNRACSTKQNRRRVHCQTTGLVFKSATEAARYVGVNASTMYSHLKGLTPLCGGKKFTYID